MLPEIPTFPPPPRRSAPLVIVIVVSLLSGFIGAMLLFWFFPEVRQARIPPGAQSVIVEGPGKVVVEESTRLRELGGQNKRLVAGLYHPEAGVKIGDATIFPDKQLIGAAVLLTADGWFITVAAANIKVGDYLLVEGKPYKIERLLADTASPFVMGKVAGDRFTSVTFIDTESRYSGMTLWTLSPSAETIKTALLSDKLGLALSDHASALIASSDKLSFGLSLTNSGDFLAGTPVFDLAGQLVGLSTPLAGGGNVILPSDALQTFMINVLKYGKPSRSYLGLSYVFDPYDILPNSQPGAIIFGEKPDNGVIAKSPAAKAGLRLGDRLVNINGAAVSSPGSVFSMIQQYNPGDTIVVEYERDNKVNEANVVLGELPAKK